jgi:TPR repeat protein
MVMIFKIMKKKLILWLTTFLTLCVVWAGFYYVNTLNYIKHKNIQASIVNHPEKLPDSDAARLGSFGFTSIVADLYWLQTIQYIWGNVIGWEYKKYLSAMMNLITDLNPYFESPYTIGQLLLPSESGTYEDTDNPENLKHYKQWEALGLKWVRNFCDDDKIKAIRSEDNLWEIVNNEKYSNPCKSYKIPYYLAYIYYFYLKDSTQAAEYYKIVSAQEDAPSWAKTLAAIMQGKWWEREKSLYMFLSLAQNTNSEDESCTLLSTRLEEIYKEIKQNNAPLVWEFIRDIELFSHQILPKLSEENEQELLDDTQCTNFLTKAIREINLMYLEEADVRYVWDNPDEISAMNPQRLLESGYINFIPTDYQQYEWEEYGIIYKYSKDTKRFDYKMWNYK